MQFNRDNAATRRKQGQKRIHNTIKGDEQSLGRENDSSSWLQVQEVNAENSAVPTQCYETILNNVCTPNSQNDLKDTPYISKRLRENDIVVNPTETLIEDENSTSVPTNEIQGTSEKEYSVVLANESKHGIQHDRNNVRTSSNKATSIQEVMKESPNLSPCEDRESTSELNPDEPIDPNAKVFSSDRCAVSEDFDFKVQFNRHNLTTMNKMISSKKQLDIVQMPETPRTRTSPHEEDNNAEKDSFPNCKTTTSKEVLECQVEFNRNDSSTRSETHRQKEFEEAKLPVLLLPEKQETIRSLATQQQEIDTQIEKTLETTLPDAGSKNGLDSELQFNRDNSSTRGKQGIKASSPVDQSQTEIQLILQSIESPNLLQNQKNNLVDAQTIYPEADEKTQDNDRLVQFNRHNASTVSKMRQQKENNGPSTGKIRCSTIISLGNVPTKAENEFSNEKLYSTSSNPERTDDNKRQLLPSCDASRTMGTQKQISADVNEFVQKSDCESHAYVEQVPLTRIVRESHEFDHQAQFNRENPFTVEKRLKRAEHHTADITAPQVMHAQQRCQQDVTKHMPNPSEAHIQPAAEPLAKIYHSIPQFTQKDGMQHTRDNLSTRKKQNMRENCGAITPLTDPISMPKASHSTIASQLPLNDTDKLFSTKSGTLLTKNKLVHGATLANRIQQPSDSQTNRSEACGTTSRTTSTTSRRVQRLPNPPTRRSDCLSTSNQTGIQPRLGQHQSNEVTRPTSDKLYYGNSSSKIPHTKTRRVSSRFSSSQYVEENFVREQQVPEMESKIRRLCNYFTHFFKNN
ncbi:uncharacterized protein LOC134218120 isoform X3 [Armigeres subalbatus]